MFLMSIAWPMIQLALAIGVIGLLIWVLGIVATRNNGEPIDILGFGLIGNRGLLIYTNFIIAVGLCIAGLVIAFRRGVFWTPPAAAPGDEDPRPRRQPRKARPRAAHLGACTSR